MLSCSLWIYIFHRSPQRQYQPFAKHWKSLWSLSTSFLSPLSSLKKKKTPTSPLFCLAFAPTRPFSTWVTGRLTRKWDPDQRAAFATCSAQKKKLPFSKPDTNQRRLLSFIKIMYIAPKEGNYYFEIHSKRNVSPGFQHYLVLEWTFLEELSTIIY